MQDAGQRVAVTPDGRRAVSASDDKTLKVWDLEPGRAAGHPGGPWRCGHGVAVTPDGRRVVSALGTTRRSRSGTWSSGRDAAPPWKAMRDWVTAVAVTPDGRRVVSASDDQTLKVWDLERGALLAHPGRPWRCGHGGGGDAGRAARGLGARTTRRSRSGTWQRGALLAHPRRPWRCGHGGGGDAGRPARGLGARTTRRSRSGTWSGARAGAPWKATPTGSGRWR